MNVYSQINIQKIVQKSKKLLINVSEELVMRNATLDNRRSLKQTFIKKVRNALTLFGPGFFYGLKVQKGVFTDPLKSQEPLKVRVFPRPFTHGGICPLLPYGGTSAGGQSVNGGETHEEGDLTLIDYIIN